MNRLQQAARMWEQAGFKVVFVSAPSEANTFDQMLIVFTDATCRCIRRVILYSSTENKIVSEH